MKTRMILMCATALFVLASATAAEAQWLDPYRCVIVSEDNAASETTDGKLRVSAVPYGYDIAEGRIAGHETRHGIGFNPSVSASIEDVTQLGVNVTPLPSAAIAMEIDSTSAEDDPDKGGAVAGTGCWSVHVEGLDASGDERNEIVATNGTTEAPLSSTWLRVNNVHCETAGTGGFAAGDITVQAVGGATDYAVIKAGEAKDAQALYTVPRGKVGYLTGWCAGGVTTAVNTTMRLILLGTADGGDRILTPGVFFAQDHMVFNRGTNCREYRMPLRFPALADIKVAAQVIDGVGTAAASGSFELWIEDE
jgi:hypothetical protein